MWYFFVTLATLPLVDGDGHVFSLRNVRPEGVHIVDGAEIGFSEGPYALVSEWAYGGIRAVNLETKDYSQIIDSVGFGERGSFGLWYSMGAILMCSGGFPDVPNQVEPEALYFFDPITGEKLAACSPEHEAGLLNDVTVLDGKAYMTDTSNNYITVVDVAAAVNEGACNVSSIELPPDTFLDTSEPPDFSPKANGTQWCQWGTHLWPPFTAMDLTCIFFPRSAQQQA